MDGGSPEGLLLPGQQPALAAAVLDAIANSGARAALVLSGSSVDVAALRDDARLGAVLWAGYAGEAGGDAIAAALFGDANPAGRLPVTWYPQGFADAWRGGVAPDPYRPGSFLDGRNASYFDAHVLPNATSGNPGRTHRFYAGETVFAFGDGLSYADFRVARATATAAAVPRAALLARAATATAARAFRRGDRGGHEDPVVHVARFEVENRGPRDGARALLAFVAPPPPLDGGDDGGDGLVRPRRSLVAFEKVFLRVGERATVEFAVRAHDLTLARRAGGRAAPRAGETWRLEVDDAAPVELRVVD